MNLALLPKTTIRPKKRLGRGYGSGKGGHTSSRGQKGQNTRGKMPVWFEGGQLPLIRRTPFIKGKFRFKPLTDKPLTVQITSLNRFADGAVVDKESLVKILKINSVKLASRGVKIVGVGALEKKLTIHLPTSRGAAKAIEKAGGKVQA
ncbi:50S ribosomal protein L15 [Candidatus Collierbacteria bacterium RIFOXYB1_FULL_49_13]|uniref:Large ribosomal subunit protein uL15 n=1 Tax=Candidatus Collierbacteria bacterium RIFOXYB1_FULL_49_13 TaxID=1817728 RepID=A0A1F5FHQ9_9BACT|nr:MAG: 50S ribosomal protein L15 [Candidatus Collierbacteria bacterium RIFOXYB1_FULL_49_13]